MISAKFYTLAGLGATYEDIWDLKLEPKSCSGIDFISQEARVAEFTLLNDAWITANILEASNAVDFNYLPVKVRIYRDEVILFSGFTKLDAVMEQQVTGDYFVSIKVYDVLYVYLDYGDILNYPLGTLGRTAKLIALDVLEEIRNSMPVSMQSMVLSCADDYQGLDWMPYWAPGYPLLDWTDSTFTEHDPAFTIDKQYFVMYESAGAVYIEYLLYEYLVLLSAQEGGYRIDYWERMEYKKLMVLDGSWTGITNTGLLEDNTYGDIADNAPTTVAAWIAAVAKLTDSYTITPDDEVHTLQDEYTGYVITDTRVTLRFHPTYRLTPVTPAEGEITSATANDVLNDMCKVLCAYLEVGDNLLTLKNKIIIPASSGYDVPTTDVIKFRRMEQDSGDMNADLSYVEYGDKVAAGLQEYFMLTAATVLPFSFEIHVFSGAHAYVVGEVLHYDDYEIMITEIDQDIHGDTLKIRGVGGYVI